MVIVRKKGEEKMIIITKASTQMWIRKYFPDFDFSKPISKHEWCGLKKILKEKDKQLTQVLWTREKELRRGIVQGKGIQPGDRVINIAEEELTVKKISSTGHLILEGKQGAFNPCSWNKVP